MIKVYYNENDQQAASLLRAHIASGRLPHGDVDDRSIEDVTPDDLEGYHQCHFFAGIGGWALALRQAGFEGCPCWTASLPCQPFSSAGEGKGFADERHLWPAYLWLVRHCRPVLQLGEQVASPLGIEWFDTVSADLEAEGFACPPQVVFPACGVGAPHIRQRQYWMAYDKSIGFNQWAGLRRKEQAKHRGDKPPHSDSVGGMGDTHDTRPQGHAWHGDGSGTPGREQAQKDRPATKAGSASNPGQTNGFWRNADWLYCRDDAWRPVEPGSFPLANGIPARVAQAALRGYGNAIVIPQAVAYIQATMGALRDSV